MDPLHAIQTKTFRLYLRAKALLDKASFTVQKLCREIKALPQSRNPVQSRWKRR